SGYLGSATATSDRTASLGIYYDYGYKGPGLKIAEVIAGGPLDKHSEKIHPGVILEKIDGMAVTDTVDHYKYLNRKADKLVVLWMYDPAGGSRWEESTKAVSQNEEDEVQYKRWVEARRKE